MAELYRDFRSLADLCHSTGPIFPLSSNVNAGRIRQYIERYKEEFTDELFLWYTEHGESFPFCAPKDEGLTSNDVDELRCMFELSDQYGSYIDAFFLKHPYPYVSWIHDLGKGRWGSASVTLLSNAERMQDLETRHVRVSYIIPITVPQANAFTRSC